MKDTDFVCAVNISRVCVRVVFFDRDCFVGGVGYDISEINDTTFYVFMCGCIVDVIN